MLFYCVLYEFHHLPQDEQIITAFIKLYNREHLIRNVQSEEFNNIVKKYITNEMELTLHGKIGNLYERLLSRIGFKNIVFSFI